MAYRSVTLPRFLDPCCHCCHHHLCIFCASNLIASFFCFLPCYFIVYPWRLHSLPFGSWGKNPPLLAFAQGNSDAAQAQGQASLADLADDEEKNFAPDLSTVNGPIGLDSGSFNHFFNDQRRLKHQFKVGYTVMMMADLWNAEMMTAYCHSINAAIEAGETIEWMDPPTLWKCLLGHMKSLNTIWIIKETRDKIVILKPFLKKACIPCAQNPNHKVDSCQFQQYKDIWLHEISDKVISHQSSWYCLHQYWVLKARENFWARGQVQWKRWGA